jgi:oxygen-dependent protoporphyrinogen oxidase
MENARVAIIGGGITGLAAAAWLGHDHGIRDVVVLEAGDRVGGKIHTAIEHGHCLEWGPQGFLDNAPDTLELVGQVGLDGRMVQAGEASAERFIVRDGALRRVPMSPLAFLGSDVLPLGGRLRVLAEAVARRRPEGDETVFDFARRRIGKRAAEVLVDAMVTGVFAGDSRQLSLAATFPRMAAMEAEYGSLTRALVARMREARREGHVSSGPAGPGGTLSSFRQGMAELPRELAQSLDDRLRLAWPVSSVGVDGRRFHVEGDAGKISCSALLMTTPSEVSARLLKGVAAAAGDPLRQIASVPIAVVMTSYTDPHAFGRPIRGFGLLVPRTESLEVLGVLFCHAIFADHAPAGTVFLRTMIGGARHPEAVEDDDDALLARTRRALRTALGADPDPDRVWVVRWPEGISQYTVGHLGRVEAAESAARGVGIELAGSPYRGVSVNDCIRQAREAAHRIAMRFGANSLQM